MQAPAMSPHPRIKMVNGRDNIKKSVIREMGKWSFIVETGKRTSELEKELIYSSCTKENLPENGKNIQKHWK
jgi:hypothetical protein